MPEPASQFLFMTCRPGADAALKQEVARSDANWRPAFSRPGFVTFKIPGNRPIDDKQLASRHWVFAHAHGISLGRLNGAGLHDLAAAVWRLEGVEALNEETPFSDLHVWQRDTTRREDTSDIAGASPLAVEIKRAIRNAAPKRFAKICKQTARRSATHCGGRVLDIVIVDPDTWFVGYHRAETLAQRWPGGAIPVPMPPHAVSRAYAKMKEAIAWSGLPVSEGDECVELGCAPGGASQALLDRGLFVTGIDPAEVDPALLEHPRFRHLRKRSKEVPRQDFLGVRWLVADMNLAPKYTLDAAEAIVSHRGVAIRGMILTLKLGDWTLAEKLPEMVARVHGWGYRDVRVRQLTTGGKELCLVALRRRELRRLSRKRRSGRKRTSVSKRGAPSRGEMRSDPPHIALTGPHF